MGDYQGSLTRGSDPTSIPSVSLADELPTKVISDRDVRIERPVAALELTMRYLDWMRTTTFHDEMSAFSRIYDRGDGPGFAKAFVDALLVPMTKRSMNGMTQYIAPDMLDMLESISETMPPDMLFPQDLTFPDGGLVVFPRPIVIPFAGTTVHGEDGQERFIQADPDDDAGLPVAALGYAPIPDDVEVVPSGAGLRDDGAILPGGGIAILVYSTSEDVSQWMRSTRDPDFKILPGSTLANSPLVLVDVHVWAYGRSWMEADPGDVVSSTVVASKVAFIRRIMLSYFRLLWQEILDAEIHPIPRAMRRRLDRLSPHGRQSGDAICVVRFRKVYEEYEDDGEQKGSGSPLKHGFVRRPHWRRIGQGTDRERLVYVRAHVVRPDLPRLDNFAVSTLER